MKELSDEGSSCELANIIWTWIPAAGIHCKSSSYAIPEVAPEKIQATTRTHEAKKGL